MQHVVIDVKMLEQHSEADRCIIDLVFFKHFELKIHKSSNYTLCLDQQPADPPDIRG